MASKNWGKPTPKMCKVCGDVNYLSGKKECYQCENVEENPEDW